MTTIGGIFIIFIKDGFSVIMGIDFEKNERMTNELDRSEKWKKRYKSFERTWKKTVFTEQTIFLEQTF